MLAFALSLEWNLHQITTKKAQLQQGLLDLKASLQEAGEWSEASSKRAVIITIKLGKSKPPGK